MDDTDVFIIVANQKKLAEELDRLRSNFSKDSATRKTQKYLDERLKRIKEIWEAFEINHMKIIPTIKHDTPYMQRNTFQRVKEIYDDFMNKLESVIPAQDKVGEIATSSGTSDEASKKIQLQRLRRLQLKIDAAITSMEEFEETFSNYSKEIHEYQQAMLMEQLRNLTELHEEFMSDATQNDLETTYVKERKYNDVKKDISQCLHRMASTLGSLKENKITSNASDTKLPPLKIPTFKGNYLEWQSFFDIFSTIIHNKSSLNDTEKMEYLKTHLEGEPLHLIQHYTFSSDNYNNAWETLKSRYNNERKIAAMHIDNMLRAGHQGNSSPATTMKNSLDAIKEGLAALNNMGFETSSWGPLIVHLTTKTFDSESRNIFEQGLTEPNKMPTLKTLLDFLERRYQALDVLTPTKKQRCIEEPRNTVRNFYIDSKVRNCAVCKGDHSIYTCQKFLSSTPKERWQLCKEAKLCINCLRHDKQSQCFSKRTCQHCNKKHHSSLHMEWSARFPQRNRAEVVSKEVHKQVNYGDQNEQNVLIATAMLKVHAGNDPERSVTIRALIDPGSQASLITEAIAQTLRLKKQNVCVEINGLGAIHAGTARDKVDIIIRPRFKSDFKLQLEALVLPKLTQNLPSKPTNKVNIKHLGHLDLADPSFHVPGQIDMIIGADAYGEIMLNGLKRDAATSLIAQRSQLGWLISGRTAIDRVNKYNVTGLVGVTSVDEQLQKFWELEEVSQQRIQTKLEKDCETLYEETYFREENGRYVVQIPFNKELNQTLKLGESKNRAIARFCQLEAQLNKNPKLKQDYTDVINEFLKLGHMVEADTSKPTQDNIYYMPHHAVIKPESTTTKLRVVFDASAKTPTGVSLNNLMLVGPKLQDDISTILMRWRTHKYVFNADIEKMYRQIKMHEDHQDYQRVLWRNSNNTHIKEYKLTTVTYGTTSAPYLAVKTLQQLAEDEKLKYPVASEVAKRDFYVDDVMSGQGTIQKCKEAIDQLSEMLNQAGFHLRKWAANDIRLLEGIPAQSRNQQLINITTDDTIKTLGIHWNTISDTFQFKVNVETITQKDDFLTKRKTLSEIAKLYDPLGWLAPVTVKAKILMQQIWKSEVDWDEMLPRNLEQQWYKVKRNIEDLEKIRIPRWIETQQFQKLELHGFCDASEVAYAAVVYSRVTLPNGLYRTTLLSAKTKVAPLRLKLQLPKLELCGAHLLSKLMADIIRTFGSQVGDVFAWTDSTITLAWIQKCPSTWKTFVANRVSEIHASIKPNLWKHVRSSDNPADCASRGCMPEQMANNKLWWNGPNWLQQENIKWPPQTQHDPAATDIPEMRKVMTLEVQAFEDISDRYSSYYKLVRVAAYCRRFIANCKNRKQNSQKEEQYKKLKDSQIATKQAIMEAKMLSVNEIKGARNAIIRAIQIRTFAEEIKNIEIGKQLNRKSKILSLNPHLNEDKILVVGGRLQNSKLMQSEKHPYILPHNEKFTKLLIEDAHASTMHGGIRQTLAKLRQEYWIPQVKRVIREVIGKCIRCYRFSAQPCTQQMGELPAARVTPSRPFTHTGVDYAGPIQVLISKGRGNRSTKGYIAIFVCFATKAVHIELVSDLSSAAFLAAVKRFTARRGMCSHFYSDNGTTFVGANKEMQQQLRVAIKEAEKNAFTKLVKNGVEWHWIPPAAPHFGGLWEACVKSTKYHLKRVIGDTTLTFEELTTVLTQIEACLNSRPLTAVDNDVSDPTILTPGHFLVGSALNASPEPIIEETKSYRSRWQLLQKMTQDFWKTWSSEYLSQLQQRTKWKQKEDNIKVGDIVLIKEERLPPTTWVMGRITEIHPGKDNEVRAATVFSNRKNLKRPISKLCRLPIDTQSAELSTSSHQEGEELVKQVAVATANTEKKKGNSLIWMLILLGLINTVKAGSTGQQHSVEIIPFINQPGIYFEDVGRASLISSTWRTIVFFNLTTYWAEFETFKECVQKMDELCKSSTQTDVKLMMCDGILLQFTRQIQQIELNNNILMHANEDSLRRQRRSPFDFIGTITNELFGVLDQRFAKQYEETIETIQVNEKHIVELLKNQTTIVDSTVNIFKKEQMETRKQINALSEFVDRIRNEKKKEINWMLFSSTAINAILIMFNYQATQGVLLDIILSIHTGHVHPLILTVKQFKAELTRMHENIPRSLMIPGERHHESILQLYKTLNARGRVTGKNIIIEITLPLLYNEEFKIYKVLPVPTFNKGNFTSIIPTSDYLLLNLQGNHFYPISKYELSLCTKRPVNNYWCNLQHPIYTAGASISSCEMSILQHNNHLQDSCLTNTIPIKAYWIEMHHPNSWIYSVPSATTINLDCDFNPSPISLTGNGILKLPANCMIHDQLMAIIGSQTMTNRITSSFLPAFNLSEQLTSLNYKREQRPMLQTDLSLEFSKLEGAIEFQKSQEHILREIKTHRIHQYSLFGSTGFLIVMVIVAAILLTRRKKTQQIVIQGSKIVKKTNEEASFDENDFCVSSV